MHTLRISNFEYHYHENSGNHYGILKSDKFEMIFVFPPNSSVPEDVDECTTYLDTGYTEQFVYSRILYIIAFLAEKPRDRIQLVDDLLVKMGVPGEEPIPNVELTRRHCMGKKLTPNMRRVLAVLDESGDTRIYPREGGYWLPETVAITLGKSTGQAWFNKSREVFDCHVDTRTINGLVDRGYLMTSRHSPYDFAYRKIVQRTAKEV